MGSPRLTYNSINIDFDRRPSIYEVEHFVRRNENQSGDGSAETLEIFAKDRIHWAQKNLTAREYRELLRWWEYVRGGAAFSFIADTELAFYADFEGKALKTNDGVAGATTRTGTALYVDPSTGLVKSVAANMARFEAGKFGQHALVVGRARTNVCDRPREFDNASWVKTGISVTANVAYITDPEGGNNADLLTGSGSGAQNAVYTTATATSAHGVAGCWVRSFDSDVLASVILAGSTGGVATQQLFTSTNEWQFIQIKNTNSPTGFWQIKVQLSNGSSEKLLVYGAVVNDANTHISHPQYADGVVSTQNNESHTIALGSEFETSKGSIAFWLYPFFDYDDGFERWFLQIEESATGVDFLRISKNAGNNFEVTFRKLDDSGSAAQIASTASWLTAMSWDNFIVVTWDLTQDNGINLYHNAMAKSSPSTNNAFSARDDINQLTLGHASLSGDFRIDDLMIFSGKILSAADISIIYNNGRAAGYRRNRWSALRVLDDKLNMQAQRNGLRYDLTANFEDAS